MGRLSSQIFVAQILILAITFTIGFALFIRVERPHLEHEFQHRAAIIGEAAASVPRIRSCLATPRPGCDAAVQRLATNLQHRTGASYVVVIDMHRVRHSHPNPALIGRKVTEPIVVTDGRVHTRTDHGATGPSANARVPLRGPGGQIVGEVSAGIKESSVAAAFRGEATSYALWFLLALALGGLASWLLARNLKRRTFGLELDDIALLLQEREATLHGIREGVVAFDGSGRVSMINDPARALLGLDASAVGHPVEDLIPAGRLRDVLLGVDTQPDDLVLTDDYALVVNRMPVKLSGRAHGAVATLRDRTELAALLRERAGERGLVESLRAQHHEFANQMHAVAGMLELGRVEDARAYLTDIRGTVAELDSSLRSTIAAPQIVGLLLGKAAEANERGIVLRIAPETRLGESPARLQVLTSVVGNLVDNAMDAVGGLADGGHVDVRIVEDEDTIMVEVSDNGPGIPPELVPRIFTHGFTTKAHPNGQLRGIGLALVHRMINRMHGSIRVFESDEGGARFLVTMPKPAEQHTADLAEEIGR
ncbi:sensor histidine kinase [Nocardioides terrisoli]|uniref:sensor histidine kinase n=1 Tax=Nocardioides terrisoli TaxID=3388267 RepID=UPI00287B5C3D|nr:sensor histidine kinase [Nocardioides marmorisolisilvae]